MGLYHNRGKMIQLKHLFHHTQILLATSCWGASFSAKDNASFPLVIIRLDVLFQVSRNSFFI